MRLFDMAARWLTRVAALFLIVMMGINVVDVILRAAFNAPIFGTYEIVELTLAAVGFFAIAETFLRKEHVSIELIDQIAPPRMVAFLEVFGLGMTLLFFALLVWYMVPSALDSLAFNSVSFDLHIPLVWRDSLVLLAMSMALLAVALMFWRGLRAFLRREGRQ